MSDVLAFLTSLHLFTLPAMVAVFVLTVLSLYWPGRRDDVERPGRIPLEDDT
jgi:cbb3-type cytochrome oxidase subunit 3